MAKDKTNSVHINYLNRKIIADGLREKLKFKEIAELINKDPRAVSREIKNHRVFRSNLTNSHKTTYLLCANRKDCPKIEGKAIKDYASWCNTKCPEFVKKECEVIKKFPFVCNGCKHKHSCKMNRQ